MHTLIIFTVSLLVGFVATAPTSNDDALVVTEDFYPDELAVYTSEHEIVKLLVPLNAINFEDDSDDFSVENESETAILFFINADIDADGKKQYKGLNILKSGKVTMLLENGRDFVAPRDDSKLVYFAADDGIYVYNAAENKADKYGSLTDSFISIATENSTDILYAVTDSHELYKVSGQGTKKEKVDDVGNVHEIVMDMSDNIFYYGDDKVVYVINAEGSKKIEGLPENPTSVQFLNPPFILDESVPFVSDKKVFILYANGSSEYSSIELQAKPSAFAPEGTIIQYYAYNKKIYEYNLLGLILGSMIAELQSYLGDKTTELRSIATRSRTDFHP